MLVHCVIGTRELHIRNANALPRSFAKGDQVFFEVFPLRWIHPSFRDKTLRIGKNVFVLVYK